MLGVRIVRCVDADWKRKLNLWLLYKQVMLVFQVTDEPMIKLDDFSDTALEQREQIICS